MEGKIRSGPGFYSEIGKKARGFSYLFQFISDILVMELTLFLEFDTPCRSVVQGLPD